MPCKHSTWRHQAESLGTSIFCLSGRGTTRVCEHRQKSSRRGVAMMYRFPMSRPEFARACMCRRRSVCQCIPAMQWAELRTARESAHMKETCMVSHSAASHVGVARLHDVCVKPNSNSVQGEACDPDTCMCKERERKSRQGSEVMVVA